MYTRRKIKKRLHKTKRNIVKIIGLQEDPVKEDFVQEDPVKEDFVQEDFVKEEEPVKEDFVQEDFVKEEPVKEEDHVKEEEPVKEEESVKEEDPVKEEDFVKEEPLIIDKIYQEEIPNIHMTSEWRIDLNTKGNRIPAMAYLELHGIGKKSLKKFMVDHILDTMQHDERLALAKQIKNPGFVPNKPLEKHILEYFDFLTIKDGERTCLVLGKTCYDLNNNWSIVIIDEDDEMYRTRFFVESDELSDIFGYIENGIFKINDTGQICSEKSTKTEMITKMNEILKLSGSNYWYDTSTSRDKPRRNSDNLSHAAFVAVTELYMRKLNSDRVNNKIWFLKPEQYA